MENLKGNEKLARFVELLKGIFELDKSDLDFGIYRIMNIRKNEIEKFLNEGLPQKVKEVLAPFADQGKDVLLKRKTEIEDKAKELGIEISASPKLKEEYEQVQRELASGTDLSALETDVYSALFSFFNRYYDEGDFISKRRYKEGVYAIPYEGEEVKLYWANQDQYYIKTSENFKDYVFTAGEWTVHFNLVDATTEQNNNKENEESKRTFMLFDEDSEKYPDTKTFECNEDSKELIIRFVFDVPAEKKKKYEEENYTKICDFIIKEHKELMTVLLCDVSADKKNPLTLMEKHLKSYVAKNTFDYFIHKDLGGFLSRELDFFIKNEIMHLDDLDTSNEARVETYLAKVRAIKKVGKILIDFLAQIENFQKKLWLKKKFVIETNWCITLDKIDESFYEEIRNNRDQVQEWIDMYAIDEIDNDIEHPEPWSEVPSVEFLKQNKNLIVDTKNFSESFKERLVSSIENLDDNIANVLLNADNFHALTLLKEKYKKQIKVLYIDPPYNAKSSEILYKNTFKHSSWLSLIQNRIMISKDFLRDDFVYEIAIDEIEQEVLGQVITSEFPQQRKICLSIEHNPRGQQGKNISHTHEFSYFIYPSDNKKYLADVKRAEIDHRNLRDSGTDSDRNNGSTFYPFIIKEGTIISYGPLANEDYHPKSNNIKRNDGTIEIWPIDDNGNEKKWRYSISEVESIRNKLTVEQGDKNLQIKFHKDYGTMRSLWKDAKFDASEYGTKRLQQIFGIEYANRYAPKLYPKSFYTEYNCIEIGLNHEKDAIILDFFAGSGTTGDVIVEMNRQDVNRNLKSILFEMGQHFEYITLPRQKKVSYSSNWKNGKPQNRNTGIPQIIKYMSLESYEDALSNIVLEKPKSAVTDLFGDDYLINYMLDIESKGSLLNVKAFTNPFDYSMKITEKNESKLRKVDVVETFNYLIGLTVVHQGATKYYSVKESRDPDYEGAVDLVNDVNGSFAFRQIEGTLPDGRRALILWRTVNEDTLKCNAALDAYFTKYRINPQDREYDIIYVNGDNNLENLRIEGESWKVQMIEIEFNDRMFEET
ncbi:MAG: site-specific DNA-methyltransferase [Fibrobacteraceae bacterium]|nr:site-specific DNA-methyltransferase [Fibrobacteraceae bacterium]